MRTLIALLLLIANFSFFVHAQTFTVIAASGRVEYQDKSGAWKKIVAGTTIPNGTKIKLENNSYAALSHSNKQTIELKNAGTYNYSDIESKTTKAPSSVTSKYVSYVVSQAQNKQTANTMNNKGMAERSIVLIPNPLMPINQTFVLEDMVTFVWKSVPKISEYTFILSSEHGQLFASDVKDTLITVNLQVHNLTPNQCYYWKVIPKGKENLKSKEFCFKKYSLSEKQNILKDVQTIQSELGNTPIAKVVLANYYEDKQLSIEALNLYRQAADTGVEEYKQMYNGFMNRMSGSKSQK